MRKITDSCQTCELEILHVRLNMSLRICDSVIILGACIVTHNYVGSVDFSEGKSKIVLCRLLRCRQVKGVQSMQKSPSAQKVKKQKLSPSADIYPIADVHIQY